MLVVPVVLVPREVHVERVVRLVAVRLVVHALALLVVETLLSERAAAVLVAPAPTRTLAPWAYFEIVDPKAHVSCLLPLPSLSPSAQLGILM